MAEVTGGLHTLEDIRKAIVDLRNQYKRVHWTQFAYEDANVGTVSLRAGASAPDLIQLRGSNVYAYAFNGGVTTEQLFGAIEVPHSADENATITFHVHWMPTSAAAGNVRWALEYYLVSPDTTIPAAANAVVVVQAAAGIAWRDQRADFPTIPQGADPALVIGSQLVFRFYRNPNHADDTYAADACVHGTIGFHYQINSVGSRQITVK